MSRSEKDFLDLQGMVHEIRLSPAGPENDPWPFMLSVATGHVEATALLHEEDAEQVVEFFDRHLDKRPDLLSAARLVVSLDRSTRQFPGDPQRAGSSRQKKARARMNGALSVWEALTGQTVKEAYRMVEEADAS